MAGNKSGNGASTIASSFFQKAGSGPNQGWAQSNNLVALPPLTADQIKALGADYPQGNGPGTATDPFAGESDKYSYRTADGRGFAPPPGSIYAKALGYDSDNLPGAKTPDAAAPAVSPTADTPDVAAKKKAAKANIYGQPAQTILDTSNKLGG